MTKNSWFDVDRDGLAKLLAQRGKAFAIQELIQNAWDEKSTVVNVELRMLPNSRTKAYLAVADNNPGGFLNISHAYTFYAESAKKSNPEQRGRFNQGEKLVLALCDEAKVVSEKSAVAFNKDGTRTNIAERQTRGTTFSATIRMTPAELDEVSLAMESLIVPHGITTTYNDSPLPHKTSIKTINEVNLPTIAANNEGELFKTRRNTTIELYRTRTDETAMLYELGIPVVALDGGDKFHINVMQKVPLNTDRDNVTPAYLRELRSIILNNTYDMLGPSDADKAWVNHALEDKNVTPNAVRDIIETRFGKDSVVFDPRDSEANSRAAANGFKVIHGGTFNKAVWENIRTTEALKPAGQIFPTPKPYGTEGAPAKLVHEDRWTPGMHDVSKLSKNIAYEIFGINLKVRIVEDFNAIACYLPDSQEMHFNYRSLGRKWFDLQNNFVPVLDVIIHELGHAMAHDHFSEAYHKALTNIAAKSVQLALTKSYIFTAGRSELLEV
jgi:hypothetical protein